MSVLRRIAGRLLARRGAPNEYATSDWGSPAETAERVDAMLRSQDPMNRIRLLPPQISGDQSLEALKPPKTYARPSSVEVHCLPFWLVQSFGKFDVVYLTKLGRTFDKQPSHVCDFSFSVSAVGPEHWASGVVLRSDVRITSAWLRLQGESTFNDAVVTDENKVESDTPMTRMEKAAMQPRYRDFRHQPNLKSHRIHPDAIPPFVMGYPSLNAQQFRTIMERSYSGIFFDDKEYAHVQNSTYLGVTALEEARTVAFPVYRLVYKTKYQDHDRVGFHDAMYGHEPGFEGHDQFLLNKSGPTTNVSNIRVTFNRYGPQPDRNDEGSYLYVFAPPPTVSMDLAHMVVDSMQQRPLDWNDPNILAADVGKSGDLQNTLGYATERILSNKVRPLPSAFEPPSLAPLILRRPTSRPHKPLEFVGRPAAKPAPPRKAQAQPKSNLKPKSQRNSTTSPRTPLLDANHKHPRPMFSLPPSATSRPEPAKSTIVMTDARGLYATLGITPDATFLNPADQNDTLNRLRVQRIILQQDHHPDVNEGKSVDKSSAVNTAFDELKTVAQRQKYQNGL